MTRKRLPNEQKTEEELFFVIFKEVIKDMGWHYFFISSSVGDTLLFGHNNNIDDVKKNGYIYHEYIGMFKDACIAVLTAKIKSQQNE